MPRQLIVVILLTAPFIYCHKLITILSDFTNDKDVEFFKTTLPWVVDNIGYDINMKFHFKDSGVNSGPRQCVLSQLTRNTYVQANYLRCLAEGKSDAECNKSLPINKSTLNRCLRFYAKRFIKKSEREFRKYKVERTPFIILPRRKIVADISPQNFLKGICALYPNKLSQPIGCIKPSPIPNGKKEPGKESEEPVPGSTPFPDEKETTKPEPKPEGEVQPEDQKQSNENSLPENGNQPEKQQPDEKPPPKQIQPDGDSTPDSKTKQEQQKQPEKNPLPDNEIKPKEQEDPNKKSPQENDTNPKKQQQTTEKSQQESGTKPGDKPSPDNVTRPKEEKDLN